MLCIPPGIAAVAYLAASGDTRMWGALGGAAILLGVGVWGDLKGVGRRRKVLAAFLAGLVLLLLAGWDLRTISIPGMGSWELGPGASALAVILWTALGTLAFAFSTGLAGLSTGLGLIGLAAFLHLGILPVFCGVAGGALLGFLPFHLPAPRLLTGRAGRLVLGFTLATLALEVPADRNIPLAIGLFAYPLVDFGLSILRRFVRGKPILLADDGSVHLRLQRYLWGSESVALAIVLGMAALGTVMAILRPNVWFLAVLAVLSVLLAFTLVALGRIDVHAVLGHRQRYRHFHLVRDYLTRRLALADDIPEVERHLRTLLEDLPLEWVCVGPWHIQNGRPDDPTLVREEADLGEQVVAWGYIPPSPDDYSLRAERRSVVLEVLAAADQRLGRLVS